MRFWLNSPLYDGETDTGGSDGSVIRHGEPVEHEYGASAVDKKPAEDTTAKELAELRRENENLKARSAELTRDMNYYARRIQEPARVVVEERRAEPVKAAPEEKPEALLDDMTVKGVKALQERGMITRDEVEELLAAQTERTEEKISDTVQNEQFGGLISKEFPEIAEDSARMDKGLAPKSELFVRTGEIYREMVALDPQLEGKRSPLLIAARQASAELKLKGKATDKGGRVAVADEEDDPAPSRRERVQAQRGNRPPAGHSEADNGTPEMTAQQREVAARLKVSPEKFMQNARVRPSGRQK